MHELTHWGVNYIGYKENKSKGEEYGDKFEMIFTEGFSTATWQDKAHIYELFKNRHECK